MMTTIAEENRKTLRQPMDVRCGLAEAIEKTATVVPFGHLADYAGLANSDDEHKLQVVMDLAGSGFKNDGTAIPMETDTTTYRYGYISAGVAKQDGTFQGGFGVTVTSEEHWEEATLWVVGQYGESRFIHFEMEWTGNSSTLTVTGWTPGTRASIVGIYLGKSWLWDNTSIISVKADLRSVGTELGGELEISSIEINAYEPEDVTDIIGKIANGSPIWYSAGYDGDMSPTRCFYLSEPISWKDNVLTVKGQDATMFMENNEIPGSYMYDYYFPKDMVLSRVDDALEGIDYRDLWDNDDYFAMPDAPEPVYQKAASPRSILARYTGLYRGHYLRVTYVDAGIPTLYTGGVEENRTIYADEIADLNVIVEQKHNEVCCDIYTNYFAYNAEIETVDATKGKTYFVDLDPPCDPSTLEITPAPSSISVIGPECVKFKAAATTTYTVKGYQILQNLEDSDNPYRMKGHGQGASYSLSEEMPAINGAEGSLTKISMAELVERSNVLYEFTYRGNPWIQPRDVLNVEIATWEDGKKTVGGLYPAGDAYPDADVYPDAEYETARVKKKEWITMTVDNLTLEHGEGGGLISKIKARKGRV